MKAAASAIKMVTIFLLILFSASPGAEELSPTRSIIDGTVKKFLKFSSEHDRRAWAGLFAENATFFNPTLSEPVVGREAIIEMAVAWKAVENEWEWKIIEGSRMAVGFRERRVLDDGRVSRWYRGIYTVTFNATGEIQGFENSFNVWDVMKAHLFFWEYEKP